MHPKEGRLSRRQVLQRAAGAAAGIGATGTLAACANTTTPVDASCGSGGTGSALAQKLVEVKPLGPGGLPLPRNDNSVTWKIAPENPAIPSGRKPEGGTLRVYNYADYIDPETVKKFEKQFGCNVTIATYNSADEAFAKLASGSVSFDVVIGLAGSHIVNLMAKQIIQPLNHDYLPNLAKNIWPELQSPFYDGGARYTVPYVVWSDGIGWRNDVVTEDIPTMKAPWDIFWHAEKYRGKVGILDDYRDGISLGLQRNAMLEGKVADLNTEDPALIRKAGDDLAQLTSIANAKIAITDYQTLPEGKTVLHHSWSGDVIGAVIYYLPKGTKPDVLSYWAPDRGGVVQNDFLFVPKGSSKPALAHEFLNFFLDAKNAYDNFVNFTGYIPPQLSVDGDALVKQGLIPKTLATAVVRRDQFASNQELLSLTVAGDKLWQDAWAKFKAG